MSRGLPLAVWTGLLTAGTVLTAGGVACGVLAAGGGLDPLTGEALAAGTVVGLLLSLVAVVIASRMAVALAALRDDALRRLDDPAAPVPADARPVLVAATAELAELAKVLDGLHSRVRLADELGRRHRRDAATAAAGVFELLSGLVAAEEGASGQLAAELHDTVAQSLMIARTLLSASPSTPQELARLSDHVEDAEEQVRAVMARTRPPALHDGDLASAVSALQADVRARYGLEVHVDWPAAPYPLPAASAVIVYRFFQEALLNVVKHADVDDAVLALEVDEHAVHASVRDQGPGFDPERVRPERGRQVGLGLLRERARLAGGRVDVESHPGTGTTLTLELPRPATTASGRVPAQRVPV